MGNLHDSSDDLWVYTIDLHRGLLRWSSLDLARPAPAGRNIFESSELHEVPVRASTERARDGELPESNCSRRVVGVDIKLVQLIIDDTDAATAGGAAELIVGVAAARRPSFLEGVLVDQPHWAF
jgi:hypothetical protein